MARQSISPLVLRESPGSSLDGSTSTPTPKERIPVYGATFELRLPEYFSIFQAEQNLQIIAERLDAFFNDVISQPSEIWGQLIQDTLLFQVLAKPLITQALLYGDRSKFGRFHSPTFTAKQDWFRPILKMINVVGLEGAAGAKWSLPRDDEIFEALAPTAAVAVSTATVIGRQEIYEHKNYEITSQLLLITVTVLHWVFLNESPEQFAAVLDEVRTRFEYSGWTAQNANRFGSILKGLVTKILRVEVAMIKASGESDSVWDSLAALTSAIEEFGFYSPFWAFKRKPDPALVQPHLDVKGCPDRELFNVAKDLLIAVDNGERPTVQVQRPGAQKKRRDLLFSAQALFDAATKWGDVIGECNTARVGDEDEKMIYDRILDKAATELVEVLSKRPRFTKSQKKQALGAFAAAVETIYRCQEAEVVDQVGEGRIREGLLLTNWAELSYDALDKQAKAGNYRLRRTIRFIQATLDAHIAFTQALEKLAHNEDSKMHTDAMTRTSAAADLLVDINSGLVNQTRLFVNEVQGLVLGPFIELQNEYDKGANRFRETYAKEEKAFEAQWLVVLKDFELGEKDFQELTLCFFEVESGGKGKDAALVKLPKLMQRVVNRFFAYEKLALDFEQTVTPEHRTSLHRLCQELQDVELRRLDCTQLYLDRFAAIASRYNDSIPQLKHCCEEIRSLSAIRDFGDFALKSSRRVIVEKVPPRLPCTAAGLLSGEAGQGTAPLKPTKKVESADTINTTNTEPEAQEPEDKTDNKKKIWQGAVDIMKDVKASSFLNIKRLVTAASAATPSTATTSPTAIPLPIATPVAPATTTATTTVTTTVTPALPIAAPVTPNTPATTAAPTVAPVGESSPSRPPPPPSQDTPASPLLHGRAPSLPSLSPATRKPPKPAAPQEPPKPSEAEHTQ